MTQKNYESIVVDGYLRKYNIYKRRLKQISDEYKDIALQIEACYSVRAMKYDGSPSGGFSELIGSEVAAFRLEKLHDRLEYLRSEQKNITAMINRVDSAIELLPDTERQIIKHKYIKNESWWATSMECNYSESQCRRLGKRAVKKIAQMIFWNKMDNAEGTLFIDD